MEELRSTDILDEEILEDARKRAFRILKTADESVKTVEAAWEKKTQDALAALRQNYVQRGGKVREEIMARLPLDKRRARSEYIEGLLRSAMEDWLSSLDRGRLLSILDKELGARLAEYRESGAEPRNAAAPSWEVVFRGLSRAELDGLLKKQVRGDILIREAGPAFTLPGNFPAVVIDTPSARISASVDAAVTALMLDRRAELAGALLGEAGLREEAGWSAEGAAS